MGPNILMPTSRETSVILGSVATGATTSRPQLDQGDPRRVFLPHGVGVFDREKSVERGAAADEQPQHGEASRCQFCSHGASNSEQQDGLGAGVSEMTKSTSYAAAH